MKVRIGRKRVWVLATVAAVLLLAGHVWFWYLPRAHGGRPAAGGEPLTLLTAPGFDGAVWLPYPHQNLAAVPGGDPWSYWDAAGILSRRERLSLLSFGPFVVPPSKEMTVAWSTGGERFAVAARVYPVFVVIARLAGWVAGNPWLAGGVVEGRDGAVTVSWSGTLWTASSRIPKAPKAATATQPTTARVPVLPEGELLALLRLGDPPPRLPVGLYALQRTAAGLAVDLAGADGSLPAEPSPVPDPDLLVPPLVLLGLAAGEGREQALALFDDTGVPGFAVFERGSEDGSQLELPLAGMGVAALLGHDGYRGDVSGWALMATGTGTYARAEALVPALDAGFALPGDGGASRLRVAVLAEPAAAGRVLGQLGRALEGLPSGDGSEARRLSALRQLLAPLARFRRGSLLIHENPDRFALRLER